MNTVPLTKEYIYPGTKLSSKTINQPAVILARAVNSSVDAWKIMWLDDSSVAEWAELDIIFKFDRILTDTEVLGTKPSPDVNKKVNADEQEQDKLMKFFSAAGPNECGKCRAPMPCSYH